MRKIILVLLIGCALWYLFPRDSTVHLGPGIMAAEPPIQLPVSNTEAFTYSGHSITPLAEFHVRAKVLSRKKYRSGREARFSPMDLALGWGDMSDESILERIDVWQTNRWYRWRVDEFPIPRRDIETQSANMHMIPANGRIESLIESVHTGEIVEFEGKLVRIDGADGWHWVSSLSRDDTGNHSCELIWVEKFSILQP